LTAVLKTHGDALKNGLDEKGLLTLINSLAGDTGKMRGSMQTLEAELETSKQEVEKIEHRDRISARFRH